jgi:hypothetical protein
VRKREAREKKRRQAAEKIGFATETRRHRGRKFLEERLEGDTPGVLYGCERKGFAEKGICKNMKTRAIRIDGARKTPWVGEEGRHRTGTLSAEPRFRDYRIRYYLTSDKLRAVD